MSGPAERRPAAAQDDPEGGIRAGSIPGGPEAPARLDDPEPPARPRPMVERIGLGAIALLFVVMFGIAAVAAWQYGEPFLAAMAGIGCLMTAWVGGSTLLRG